VTRESVAINVGRDRNDWHRRADLRLGTPWSARVVRSDTRGRRWPCPAVRLKSHRDYRAVRLRGMQLPGALLRRSTSATLAQGGPPPDPEW